LDLRCADSRSLATGMINYPIGPHRTQVTSETKPDSNPNSNRTYPTNPTKP